MSGCVHSLARSFTHTHTHLVIDIISGSIRDKDEVYYEGVLLRGCIVGVIERVYYEGVLIGCIMRVY